MSLRRLLTPLLLVAALLVAPPPSHGATASDATAFIKDVVDKGLQALNNKQMSEAQREKEFRVMLDNDFDVPRIARFVLGRYWQTASEQDRKNFEKLFEDYIVRSYAQRFSEYSGEQVKITGARPVNETTTLVSSQILRPNGAPPAKVDWRVRREGQDFRITDIDLEGVSMLITQREQFSSVIQRNGGTVAGLNKTLEEKLASGDTSLAAPMLPKKE